jgi:hypothetical protein
MKAPAAPSASYRLPLFLAAQAALLFWRLDLLPVWGDELFTLDTSGHPLGQIAEIVRGDIHPPLYYFLVHYWMGIPWPVTLIAKVRALSGVWALATTVLLYKIWLPAQDRWRFLLLWTLSPCLILYGRMARSYTLQLFLGCLVLYWGTILLREPSRRGALWIYTITGALLFYTHYLPALAIAGAIQVLLLYRLIRGEGSRVAATAPVAIMLALYAPWLMNLGSALERAARTESYALSANPVFEQLIRLGYLSVSFTAGEAGPWWSLAAGALLAPALLLAEWRGRKRDWLPAIPIAAVIGYAGAARWVSFAFIPARLLFLLPFFLMAAAKRTWACAILAGVSLVGLHSYYRQEDFLNKGYLLPLERIADIIQEGAGGRPAQLIIDTPGLDVSPLVRRLNIPASPRPQVIWVLSGRNRGAPPSGAREVWRGQFVRYSALDDTVMKLLHWPTRPTHVLELTEYLPE